LNIGSRHGRTRNHTNLDTPRQERRRARDGSTQMVPRSRRERRHRYDRALRYMATRTKSLVPGFSVLVAASDRDRARGECCALCDRAANETMKRCGRCKVAKYFAPDVRACQKIDCLHHKKGCVKVAEVAKEGLSFWGRSFKPLGPLSRGGFSLVRSSSVRGQTAIPRAYRSSNYL
jgi:hypothetical protein